MTNSIKIIIKATLIHIAAIVYGIINGYWDAVILSIILIGSTLIYYFNKYKKDSNKKANSSFTDSSCYLTWTGFISRKPFSPRQKTI